MSSRNNGRRTPTSPAPHPAHSLPTPSTPNPQKPKAAEVSEATKAPSDKSAKSKTTPVPPFDQFDTVVPGLDIILINPKGILLPPSTIAKYADIMILPVAYIKYAGLNDIGNEPKNVSCRKLNSVANVILRNLDSDGFFTCKNGMRIFLDRKTTFSMADASLSHYTDKIAILAAKRYHVPILTNNSRIDNTVRTEYPELQTRILVQQRYTGRRKLPLPASLVNSWAAKGRITLEQFEKAFPNEAPLRTNEFVEWQMSEEILDSITFDDKLRKKMKEAFNNGAFWEFIGRFRQLEEDGGEWCIQQIKCCEVPYFKPRHAGQAMFEDLFWDGTISRILILGAAGSGKTHGTVAMATDTYLDADKSNAKYRNMVLIANEGELGKEIGFLPGNQDLKIWPKLAPIIQNLAYNLMEKAKRKGNPISFDKAKKTAEQIIMDKVEKLAMIFVPGITYEHTIIVGDECQNNNMEQIESMLTRGGTGSKTLLFGDVRQSTLKGYGYYMNPFDYVFCLFGETANENPGVAVLEFSDDEQARDPDIVNILKTLNG